MFNLSETAKVSYSQAIFRETDRTSLYSQYIKNK